MDNLSRDMIRAKALGYGVHYGKYKADHPGPTVITRPEVQEEEIKICAYCGEPFSLIGRSRRSKYCSNTCFSVSNKKRAREKAREKSGISDDEIRICAYCGKEFRLGGRHGSSKCCSGECAALARRARRGREGGKRNGNEYGLPDRAAGAGPGISGAE